MKRRACVLVALLTLPVVSACDTGPTGPTVLDLEVSALVSPEVVRLGRDSLTVTIAVFNPNDADVSVALGDGFRQTSDPETSRGLAYRFRLFDQEGRYHGGLSTWGTPEYHFEVTEVKTHTFVLPLTEPDVIEALQLEPGRFDLVPSFGRAIGDTVRVEVVAE